MATVQEVLREALNLVSSLQLERIPMAPHQSPLAKATEIAWKDVNRYGRIMLMMGNLHTIGNFM